MVTQFTNSYMVKNKSKNKKTLLDKVGREKNNKTAALISISASQRPSHGYVPAGAMYTGARKESNRKKGNRKESNSFR